MIRMIASDLDGTLLQNGSQKLNEEIFPLIKRLKQLGILFVAASGRQYDNLRRLFEPVKDDIVYIAENGCLIFYQDKILHKDVMRRELGEDILHTIWNKEDAEILLSGQHTSYIQPKDEEFGRLLRDVVKNHVTVVENIFQTEEEYFKISVYEKEGIEKSQSYWEELYNDQVSVVTSGNVWLDMMPKGVNKGTAMKKLQEYFHVDAKECMAFGDYYNDVEMLQAVKYGYAVENAQEYIKKICHYRTDRVETILKKVINEAEVQRNVRV